jgi:hypothetical protein
MVNATGMILHVLDVVLVFFSSLFGSPFLSRLSASSPVTALAGFVSHKAMSNNPLLNPWK